MPSPFQAISIASSALQAFQQALSATSNNISNVNTPGYSRQTVDFATVSSTTYFGLQQYSLGQGVNISSVNRIQDAFLSANKLVSSSDLGATQTYSDQLKQVEAILNDTTGTGISSALDNFFNSWSALAANPNQAGLATAVQQAGNTLAMDIRSTYANLSSSVASQNGAITQTVNQINTLSKQISDLNKEIRAKSTSGNQPNDLLDQRDQALQSLSKLVDIKTYTMGDGSVAVYSNQLTLVDSGGSHTYPSSADPATSTVTDANGTYDVHGGQLAGLFQAVNATKGYMSQLDQLANSLRTQVNAIHSTGINQLGNTGVNFFNDSSPQTGATDFDLDPAVKANAQAIAAGISGNAGDGGLATELANLSSTSVAALGNQTYSAFYTGFVGKVGSDSASAQTIASTKSAVDTQISNQIQSVSGVNLDDEMANLLKFQRSYQAAAQALSVFDQTTNDLINMLR